MAGELLVFRLIALVGFRPGQEPMVWPRGSQYDDAANPLAQVQGYIAVKLRQPGATVRRWRSPAYEFNPLRNSQGLYKPSKRLPSAFPLRPEWRNKANRRRWTDC